MSVRQFGLFSVADGAVQQPEMPPADIEQGSAVALDSRRLLGLKPDAPLPDGFADPNVVVELYPVVEYIMDECSQLLKRARAREATGGAASE